MEHNAFNMDKDQVQEKGKGKGKAPAFELVVLGSGGGPLETDCSG
jgi:hypothetical protein